MEGNKQNRRMSMIGVGNDLITYDSFPKELIFLNTSRCNLSCWHCSKNLRPFHGHDAKDWLIDYVHDKVLPYCSFLRIGGNGIGEPLLGKNFGYFLGRIDRTNRTQLKRISLITNLTLLDQEKAELISEKVDRIEISLEGVEENYCRTRKFKWDKFVYNLAMLNDVRRTSKSMIRFFARVCTLYSNLDNLLKIFMLKDKGIDGIVFDEFVPYENLLPSSKSSECLWKHPEEVREFIEKIEQKSRQVGIPVEIAFKGRYSKPNKVANQISRLVERLSYCYSPWKQISVDSSGNVSACCKNLRLGKILNYNSDMLGILNNPKSMELRARVNSDDPPVDCIYCEKKRSNLSDRESKLIRNDINLPKKYLFKFEKAIRHLVR